MSAAQITYIAISPDDLNGLVRKAARALVQEQTVSGVSKKVACARWNISETTFDRMVKDGELKVYSYRGTLPRYKISDLDALFKPEK